MDLRDPIAVALGAAEALGGLGIPHALYGGLLLAAYGEARETRDADLAVIQADAREAAGRLEQHFGVRCLLAFEEQRFGGLLLSRLTLLEEEALNSVDLVTPVDSAYAARALDRCLESSLRDRAIRVLTPEDFVVFTLLSSRDRDLDDARSVVEGLGDDLDLEAIAAEVVVLSGDPAHPLEERWARLRSR